jgi:hypothetical protein
MAVAAGAALDGDDPFGEIAYLLLAAPRHAAPSGDEPGAPDRRAGSFSGTHLGAPTSSSFPFQLATIELLIGAALAPEPAPVALRSRRARSASSMLPPRSRVPATLEDRGDVGTHRSARARAAPGGATASSVRSGSRAIVVRALMVRAPPAFKEEAHNVLLRRLEFVLRLEPRDVADHRPRHARLHAGQAMRRSSKKHFQNDSSRRQQRIAQASLRNARWTSGVRS